MNINFSPTRALAIDCEFENSQLNCTPHPNKSKEDLDPSEYWTKLFCQHLVLKTNLQTKQFS